MEAGLVDELGRHQARPAHQLDPNANRPQGFPSLGFFSLRHAAKPAGTITAPECTGPPSKVSSKSSPWAAVPLTNAAPAASRVRACPTAVQRPSASQAASAA